MATPSFVPNYLALAPSLDEMPGCGATRFRWVTHIALPFTLPFRTCIHQRVRLGGREYEYSIHNFLDRLIVFPNSSTIFPLVHLVARREPPHPAVSGRRYARETLQSVACFVELGEYGVPNGPLVDAIEKINDCFRHLADHLASLQRAMPYLASWHVYPISQFDVGMVYHGVDHFCPNKNAWATHASAVLVNTARISHHPECFVEPPSSEAITSTADLSNELLAEAQVALIRGLYRSTVLNSYQAVESLANDVFKERYTAKRIADGCSPAAAEVEAEAVRLKNRTRIKFLVNQGLSDTCGRSLFAENGKMYGELCDLHQFRHQVAHAGLKPSQAEAAAGHVLCCKVVQWLCEVGTYPVRPLLPEPHEFSPDLASIPSEVNAVPGPTEAYLLWLLGMAPTQERQESPCLLNIQMGVTRSCSPGGKPEVQVAVSSTEPGPPVMFRGASHKSSTRGAQSSSR